MKMNEDDVVFKYTESEVIEDGVLRNNPRRDVFDECSIITGNLFDTLDKIAKKRNEVNVLGYETTNLIAALMNYAKDIYENNKFKGEDDKDFFAIPAGEDTPKVWFVRNENGKLTAMLPEDY